MRSHCYLSLFICIQSAAATSNWSLLSVSSASSAPSPLVQNYVFVEPVARNLQSEHAVSVIQLTKSEGCLLFSSQTLSHEWSLNVPSNVGSSEKADRESSAAVSKELLTLPPPTPMMMSSTQHRWNIWVLQSNIIIYANMQNRILSINCS